MIRRKYPLFILIVILIVILLVIEDYRSDCKTIRLTISADVRSQYRSAAFIRNHSIARNKEQKQTKRTKGFQAFRLIGFWLTIW